ncbi:hypothetical protein NXS15_03140 [Mycoplasma sp. CSL7475-4]|uniref:hypothetical protein n=1 Tax=Mycoplasma sp. CSL7475-4 TaxID=2973942 RepID=UPI00216B4CF9|nr:hypothetical protein [Mycoplasma sp. CSL7475-4]MCS4537106.1 hypothetical protein [Mycoplasma sp. CSL7475-4]
MKNKLKLSLISTVALFTPISVVACKQENSNEFLKEKVYIEKIPMELILKNNNDKHTPKEKTWKLREYVMSKILIESIVDNKKLDDFIYSRIESKNLNKNQKDQVLNEFNELSLSFNSTLDKTREKYNKIANEFLRIFTQDWNINYDEEGNLHIGKIILSKKFLNNVYLKYTNALINELNQVYDKTEQSEKISKDEFKQVILQLKSNPKATFEKYFDFYVLNEIRYLTNVAQRYSQVLNYPGNWNPKEATKALYGEYYEEGDTGGSASKIRNRLDYFISEFNRLGLNVLPVIDRYGDYK